MQHLGPGRGVVGARYFSPKRYGKLKSTCTVDPCHRRPIASLESKSISGP